MSSPPPRLDDLFQAALELPPGDRARYLDACCAGDAALRQRVEDLLAAHGRAGGFLTAPAALGPLSTSPPGAAEGPAAAPGPLAEGPGTVIGHYRLLQAIGEGGFGTVFMAEQERPVRRKVALKIIKLGMDTRQVVARFEQERQALAVMDHPSIAKVFDAGATDTGRPYFVMELVRGEPITAYCDRNHLSIAERLALFEQVCGAVQHAHTKGIIHRDLKPSNVLVGMHDGRAQAKVIDFGIAKATDHRLTEKTFFTEFKQFMGTPEYMSPEQAEGSLDIDTRTDVYSLGVLLYELLTGGTPFDPKRLRSAAYAEMQRIIREEEPAKPSTRLSHSADTLASVAAARRVEPRRLGTMVRGELDWIVMKALEKDRGRRYGTANGLAEDVRRHLAADPVAAAPPSSAYRLRKFVRRHRVGVVSGAVVAGALVVGTGAAGAGLIVALRARDAAESNAQAAKKQAARSDRVASVLTDTLAAAGPRVAQGRDSTILREIMDQTAVSLATELTDYPDVEGEIRTVLGSTYRDIEAYDEARRELDRAIDLFRSLGWAGEQGLAGALESLAELHLARLEWRKAAPLLDEAMAIHTRRHGENSRQAAANLDLQGKLATLGGDLIGAERTLRRALSIKRRVLPPGDPEIGNTLNSLGINLSYRRDFQAAVPLLREAVEASRRADPQGSVSLASNLSNYGYALRSAGDIEEARLAIEEALAMHRRLLGVRCTDAGIDLSKLGSVHEGANDLTAAERCYREALDILTERLGADHEHVAMVSNNMGFLFLKMGDPVSAEEWLTRTLAIAERILGADHPNTAQSVLNLGLALQEQHRPVEATAHFRRALGVFLSTEGPNAPRVQLSRVYMARAIREHAAGELAAGGGEVIELLDEAATLAAEARAEIETASWLTETERSSRMRETALDLAEIFDLRHRAQPGQGHDATASQWRACAAATSSPVDTEAPGTPGLPPP